MKNKFNTNSFFKNNLRIIFILGTLLILLTLCFFLIYFQKTSIKYELMPSPTITTTPTVTITELPTDTITTTKSPTITSKPTTQPSITNTTTPILLTNLSFTVFTSTICDQNYYFEFNVSANGSGNYSYIWEYNKGNGWIRVGQYTSKVINGTVNIKLTTPFKIETDKNYTIRMISISPNNINSVSKDLGKCTPDIPDNIPTN